MRTLTIPAPAPWVSANDRSHWATKARRTHHWRIAAGRLAWAIAVRKPGLQMPAMELHAWQVEEKQRQAESFAAWLVKQGKRDDVAREWPIQHPPAGWEPNQIAELARLVHERDRLRAEVGA